VISFEKEVPFWSVYGHLPQGGAECFVDFSTEQDAHEFANKLLSIFPNLHKYGLTYT